MTNKTIYSSDFKAGAVKLVNESEKPTSQVAKELGIKPSLLYSWLKKYRRPEEVKAVMDRMSQLETENKRLKAELKRSNEERDILKKSTAYFARESA